MEELQVKARLSCKLHTHPFSPQTAQLFMWPKNRLSSKEPRAEGLRVQEQRQTTLHMVSVSTATSHPCSTTMEGAELCSDTNMVMRSERHPGVLGGLTQRVVCAVEKK